MSLSKEKIKTKQRLESLGIKISICSNLMFVGLELLVFHLSGSRAVLLDGLFDGSETVLLLFSMWLMKYLYKPVSEKRPIGYSNLEPFYMIMKGLIFCIIAALAVVSSVNTLLEGGYEVHVDTVFYFEGFAGVYRMVILMVMKRINQKVDSPILSLETKEWSLDVAESLGVGAGFLLTMFTRGSSLSFLSQYSDQIITLIMAAYILPAPVKAMVSGFRELFFLSPSEEVLNQVKSAAGEIAGEYGFSPEELDFDIVKTGRRLWICIYVEINSPSLNVELLRNMREKLEHRYAPLADILDVDIIPDI